MPRPSKSYELGSYEYYVDTFQFIVVGTDCLDDELGDGEEALEGDAEVLGADHAVTAGREEGGHRVIVIL